MSDRIKAIQTRLGVPADGVIGPQTLSAIEKALGIEARTGSPLPKGLSGTAAAASAPDGATGASDGAFERALRVILRHEGGYVNHPKDPGGRTNLGVTQRTWESWTGKPSSEAEMRALTPEKVAPVYRKNYWDKLRCGELPPALALCVFDFGVNAGPARAARYLQKLVGVVQDGVAGPATVAAVKAWAGRIGEAEAVRAYQNARRGYYRQLSTFATFGRGWLRRVDETETEALRMVK